MEVIELICTFLEKISPLINTIIGFATLVLSGIAIHWECKERRKIKRRKQSWKEMTENLKKLDSLIDFCQKYDRLEKTALSYEPKYTVDYEVKNELWKDTEVVIQNEVENEDKDKRLMAYIVALKQKLIDETELFPIIKGVYRKLLMDEEFFSMSYGYGRYIDAFRKMVMLEDEYKLVKEGTDAQKKMVVYEKIYREMLAIMPYIREIPLKFQNLQSK